MTVDYIFHIKIKQKQKKMHILFTRSILDFLLLLLLSVFETFLCCVLYKSFFFSPHCDIHMHLYIHTLFSNCRILSTLTAAATAAQTHPPSDPQSSVLTSAMPPCQHLASARTPVASRPRSQIKARARVIITGRHQTSLRLCQPHLLLILLRDPRIQTPQQR